jgi:hypothetical protein
MYVCMYVCMYMYMCVCVCVYVVKVRSLEALGSVAGVLGVAADLCVSHASVSVSAKIKI